MGHIKKYLDGWLISCPDCPCVQYILRKQYGFSPNDEEIVKSIKCPACKRDIWLGTTIEKSKEADVCRLVRIVVGK